VLAALSNPSPVNRCPLHNITDDIRASIRSYQFCNTQANLSTPDQVTSFYEQGVQHVVALVIATKMDVISLVNSSSTQQDLKCPYRASVYDACTDGMCLVSKIVITVSRVVTEEVDHLSMSGFLCYMCLNLVICTLCVSNISACTRYHFWLYTLTHDKYVTNLL